MVLLPLGLHLTESPARQPILPTRGRRRPAPSPRGYASPSARVLIGPCSAGARPCGRPSARFLANNKFGAAERSPDPPKDVRHCRRFPLAARAVAIPPIVERGGDLPKRFRPCGLGLANGGRNAVGEGVGASRVVRVSYRAGLGELGIAEGLSATLAAASAMVRWLMRFKRRSPNPNQ